MYENSKKAVMGEGIENTEQRKKQYDGLIFHNKLQINHILFITSYN